MEEFLFVSTCQRTGDMIVFDDVTQLLFPGVVEAVKNIEKNYPYNVHHIKVDEEKLCRRYSRVNSGKKQT